ncbi:MAG: lipid-A-disaccharide synthase [Candidatus Kapaibacteriales bacterium]
MRIFVVAGDYSGDIHGAKLMRELKTIYPDIVFEGIGGSNMEAEGLKTIVDFKSISVVGFMEVAKKYAFFKRLLNECIERVTSGSFDLLLTIDYPGFNLRLAKAVHARGVKTCQYIAPQAWAWGKDRAKSLSEYIDKLLVVFPFEVDFFENYDIDVEFVGHPLMDEEIFSSKPLSFESRDKTIAFLPGSRSQEIKRHSKLYYQVIKNLRKELPGYDFAIAKTRHIDMSAYKELLIDNNIRFEENSRELMSSSCAGIVKTGTSTLEAALLGMPFQMVYKTSFVTYNYAKYVMNLPYISLVNILRNDHIVKEYIQSKATVHNITQETLKLVSDKSYRNKLSSNFSIIRKELGKEGASKTAAAIISKLLD